MLSGRIVEFAELTPFIHGLLHGPVSPSEQNINQYAIEAALIDLIEVVGDQ